MNERSADKASSPSRPSINGRAYPLEDHTYDIVVVGAGYAGLLATVRHAVVPTAPTVHERDLHEVISPGLMNR